MSVVWRFLRLGVRRARLEGYHQRVLQRFPGTPWVYGGSWSFFSSEFRALEGLIVYPYIPLVLVDSEMLSAGVFSALSSICSQYGIPVFEVSSGDSVLDSILDSLEERRFGG